MLSKISTLMLIVPILTSSSFSLYVLAKDGSCSLGNRFVSNTSLTEQKIPTIIESIGPCRCKEFTEVICDLCPKGQKLNCLSNDSIKCTDFGFPTCTIVNGLESIPECIKK